MHSEMYYKKVRVLGIDFINEPVGKVVEVLKKEGGLMVVPAAPALVNIKADKAYYESLLAADLAIADSSYMAIWWNFFRRPRINRISGLEFLRVFLYDKEIIASNDILLVNPTIKEAEANKQLLNSIGFRLSEKNQYQAPFYDKKNVHDNELLEKIKALRPRFIIINIGGGTQEKLGAWIKSHLDYKPGIVCTGAAIAFLTGHQANIPHWADKLHLGWFMRCISEPKLYVPRYWNSFKLAGTILRFGSREPT